MHACTCSSLDRYVRTGPSLRQPFAAEQLLRVVRVALQTGASMARKGTSANSMHKVLRVPVRTDICLRLRLGCNSFFAKQTTSGPGDIPCKLLQQQPLQLLSPGLQPEQMKMCRYQLGITFGCVKNPYSWHNICQLLCCCSTVQDIELSHSGF